MKIYPASRVFTAHTVKDAFGGSRSNGRSTRAARRRSNKISIAWWLVPSVLFYLVLGVLLFG